jgi:hypothetical protein
MTGEIIAATERVCALSLLLRMHHALEHRVSDLRYDTDAIADDLAGLRCLTRCFEEARA